MTMGISTDAIPAATPPAVVGSTRPHPALRAHVSRYVQVALDLPPGGTTQHQISALTGAVAAVVWSGRISMDGAGGEILPCCLIGPLTRWRDNVIAGSLRSFCVHFTPLGANALLRLQGCGFQDHAVAFADLLDPSVEAEARAWADQVMHAQDFAGRAAVTDAFLLHRLGRAAPLPELIVRAVAHIARTTAGPDRVVALASELACSERTLRRHFREELGLSVKRFARITRFQRAHAYLQKSRRADWAGAAAHFGYVDQAHLIHEYREFAGTTPARFDAAERFLDTALTR